MWIHGWVGSVSRIQGKFKSFIRGYYRLPGLCFPLASHLALTPYLICFKALPMCASMLVVKMDLSVRGSGKLAKLIIA